MSLLWLVSQYDNRQKRELIESFRDRGACDADHAIDLSDIDVKPSILRSMISRKIVRRTPSGRYFLDPSRVHEAYGASNSFILYAMGTSLVVMLVIIFW